MLLLPFKNETQTNSPRLISLALMDRRSRKAFNTESKEPGPSGPDRWGLWT